MRALSELTVLMDEHHDPPLRRTLGGLLTAARTADLAVTHVRLAGLDLDASEVVSVRRCRLMIGQLDATFLDPGDHSSRPAIDTLRGFAASGRLEVRAAPHHSWNPDFSVFAGLPGLGAVALVGAHYFGKPYPIAGTAFTCVLARPAQVLSCANRFEQLWAAGYDVLPIILETLNAL